MRPMNASLRLRDQQRTVDRLVKQFRVSKKMQPFIDRTRLRFKDLDLTDPARASEFERCSETMRGILAKKKISGSDADGILLQTFETAADHQLERLRRKRFVYDLERSKKDLGRLIKHIDRLADAISGLPPFSKGRLNKIIDEQNWRHFDTEMFSELIHAMLEALAILSPACAAHGARLVISESFRASRDPAITRVVRTAPPVIVELWQIIPAETRTQVGARFNAGRRRRGGRLLRF
jgi:hypothetical protein